MQETPTEKHRPAEVGQTPGGKPTARYSQAAGGTDGNDLDVARGIVAHPAGHSDQEIADACRQMIDGSNRHEDHCLARELLGMIEV